ncbi:MAG: sulfatase-like hydrolase/transferase [Bryobacterales bacterium]|nr:sulfatase-like hydrolase/transferase [Bryobacterales bacterium]
MTSTPMRILLLVLLAVPLGAQTKANFVVILSDDQSWVGSSVLMEPEDDRSRSDYFRTPGIERLAKRGMTFTDGYSPAPFCCPTRRSLQVGQTPARHLYQRDQEAWPADYRGRLNIPKVLKSADSSYRTAHFGKWDHRFDMPTPSEMGYDASDGYTSNGTGGAKGSGGPAAVADPKLVDHITRQACQFMEQQAEAGNPFYLQISHYAVHLDIFYRRVTLDLVRRWQPGKKHYMPEFAAMTSDMDASVDRVLDKIDELGLTGRTFVFFLSDNGGRSAIPGAGDPPMPRNHPLRGSKGSMYEGGIRVPFLVAGPGIEPGSVNRTPVTGLDILPTLADLAGYDSKLPESVDGGSLRAAFDGGTVVARNRDFLIFHQAVTRNAQSALRVGNWKIVKTWAKDVVELFDLSNDKGETANLAGRQPQRARDLETKLDAFLAEVGAETRKTED